MRYRDHPEPDALLRFLRDEASGAERREVVRHLLTGCPDCVTVTRGVWHLPSRTSVIREAAREETELNAI